MKKVIILLLVAAVIAVLFVTLRMQSQSDRRNRTNSGQNELIRQVKTYTINIRDSKTESDKDIVKLSQGDEARLTVISDTSDELHLHGYDKEVELIAGQPSEITLTATMTGRFEAELHHTGETAFVLEVQPK